MGNASAKSAEVKIETPATQEKPKLKPCCACPETKRARDACIIENGEENCGPLIEEHKACMRKMGFNI
ncbi:cytochrome c oxidase copper chaperone-like [Aphomia sociella]